MFEKMIESRSHRQDRAHMSRFVLPVSATVLAVLGLALTYSLFAYTFSLDAEIFDLSQLAAPVDVEPAPAPAPPRARENASRNDSKNVQIPQRLVRSIEAPISVPPKNLVGRTNPDFGSDVAPIRPNGPNGGGPESIRGGEGVGIGGSNSVGEIRKPKIDDTEPPPISKPKNAPVKPTTLKISHVINGMAKSLVKPRYPETARAIHLTGQVQVQVTIDEDGNVIAADVLSGHVFFRKVSIDAARATKFTPTILGEQKVKVTGVIIYNFNG